MKDAAIAESGPPGMAAAHLAAASRVSHALLLAVALVAAMHGEAPWAMPKAPANRASSGDLSGAVGPARVTDQERRLRGLPDGGVAPRPLQLEEIHSEHKKFTDSLIEFVAGWLCFFMSICILWLNEGHAARMSQLYAFAERRVRSVPATPVCPENARELVFVTGQSQAEGTLALKDWASLEAPPNSAKLRAKTWMWQWVEIKKDSDNNTTYEYKKDWVHHAVDSAGFRYPDGHGNPPAPQPFKCLELGAVCVGDFALSQKMLARLSAWKPCEVESRLEEFSGIESMQGYKKGQLTTYREKQSVFFARSGSSGSPSDPDVGDLMTVFEYVPCGPTSLMGVQVAREPPPAAWTMVPLQFTQHHSFGPMLARASTATTNLGDQLGQTLLGENEKDEYEEEGHEPIDRLKLGLKSFLEGFPNPAAMADKFMSAVAPDEILAVVEKEVTPSQALAQERNFEKALTAILRLFGFLLMYVSINAIFAPLRWIFAYLWIIGAILKIGLQMFACMCAASCSCLTISVANVAYRPVYAVVLLGCSAMLVFGIYSLSQGDTSPHSD